MFSLPNIHYQAKLVFEEFLSFFANFFFIIRPPPELLPVLGLLGQ